jgi:tetratricopeptide (TPR) repeat protein
MAAYTLYFYAGQRDVAAAAVDRALTLNPNSAHAWMVRGYVSLSLDQTGPVIAALERAMRLSPLDGLRRTCTNGIALAHLRERRYEQALDWAEQTLREEPGYLGALLSKAVASAHLGQTDQARAMVRQMIELRPGLTIAQWSAFWSRSWSPEKISIYVEGLRKAGLPKE